MIRFPFPVWLFAVRGFLLPENRKYHAHKA